MPTRAGPGRTEARRPRLTPQALRNRRAWERWARPYEARHRATLRRGDGLGWGLWHIPESELDLLGPVRGKRLLELGCGAAHWSVGLARRGARVTGLDVSPRRLAQARSEMARAGVEFPLVEASAESVPLPSRSFDIVFCDWGAMTFCDPYRTVPEVARLLRPGGVFAFSNASVFRSLCQEHRSDRIGTRLRYDYFTLHRIRYPGEVDFQLPTGEWLRLFRDCGFAVEKMIEPRSPARGRTTYLTAAEARWGRRWPQEVLWKLRRTGALERPKGRA